MGSFLSGCRGLYLADGSRISEVSRRPDYTLFREDAAETRGAYAELESRLLCLVSDDNRVDDGIGCLQKGRTIN